MDLILTLRNKIEALEIGPYMPGLRAVLAHIEKAHQHLTRGQNEGDDTAFTDAIYRTNQAFEGSIKEAYRVLTEKDPAHKKPYEIEKYLEENKKFRGRVLKQMTSYRTEWRNPSAHDYQLDFDENEAFLAIVTVAAVSCLLLDQITEHLAFQRSLAKAKASNMQAQLPAAIHPHLIEQAASVIRQFSATSIPKQAGKVPLSEIYFIGALHGFFSTVAPMLQIEVNKNPNESVSISAPSLRADLLLSRQGQRVIIEVKRNIRSFDKDVIDQMERYMQFFGTKEAILFIAPKENGDLVRQDIEVPTLGGRIIVLRQAAK
jgi:hypothetical protein